LAQVIVHINYIKSKHYKIVVNIDRKGPKTIILKVHLPYGIYLKNARPSPISYNNRYGIIKWILSCHKRHSIFVEIITNKDAIINVSLKYRDPTTKRIITRYFK